VSSMIAHKCVSDRSERFVSAHKEHFFVIFSIVVGLIFGYKMAVDRGERGFPLPV
jgi:hypothetical protein